MGSQVTTHGTTRMGLDSTREVTCGWTQSLARRTCSLCRLRPRMCAACWQVFVDLKKGNIQKKTIKKRGTGADRTDEQGVGSAFSWEIPGGGGHQGL